MTDQPERVPYGRGPYNQGPYQEHSTEAPDNEPEQTHGGIASADAEEQS